MAPTSAPLIESRLEIVLTLNITEAGLKDCSFSVLDKYEMEFNFTSEMQLPKEYF